MQLLQDRGAKPERNSNSADGEIANLEQAGQSEIIDPVERAKRLIDSYTRSLGELSKTVDFEAK